MTTWFTSDQHYWHANIIGYSGRPFANVEAMNEALIANYNAVVKPDDTCISVGDFSLVENRVKSIVEQLNGHKVLIAGNHDMCHPANKRYRARNVQRYLDYGFDEVLLRRVANYGFGDVLITHVPIGSQRYTEYQPTLAGLANDKIQWVIHGHVHEAWKKRGNMVNVGVDAWGYSPVSVEQLAEYLATAPENDPVPLATSLSTLAT